MTTEQDPDTRPVGPWDGVIGELRELRRRAGEPSFRVIAQRVAEQRVANGQDPHAARIATSSVHDAFRLGRSRINLPLVRELVRALGADESLVTDWLERPEQVEDAAVEPGSTEPSTDDGPAGDSPASGLAASALLFCCVLLNLAGVLLVSRFSLPIYLDMMGTAIAAISLGPWRGAVVGLATNTIGIANGGLISLDFAAVNVAGALVWGYGVTAWGLGRTLPRFLALNALAGAACTALAVPILWWNFGPHVRFGQDLLTEVMEESVHPFLVAETLANLMTSLADKTISGFLALVVVSALPPALRASANLPIASAG